MITISTHQGKQVEIVLESELRAPMERGAHVRAYCHIHGSDHQRSLSITKATGWGLCWLFGTSVQTNRRLVPKYREWVSLLNEYAGGYLRNQAER